MPSTTPSTTSFPPSGRRSGRTRRSGAPAKPKVTTVRDEPLNPDPGFADLYAALPDADDLWPWLDWCIEAKPPVLYLGIGAGRLAVPLRRLGIQIVGVDAHPGMVRHMRRRAPDVQVHLGLIEKLHLRRRFDLVIAPSGTLTADANLAAAVRHLGPGGRIGMELLNPHWLYAGRHRGVRVRRLADGGISMEVDYRLPDGSKVVQVVDRPYARDPRQARRRLTRFGLVPLSIDARPGLTLADTPTYFVLAGRKP